MGMKLRPLGDRILVMPIPESNRTEGGLYKPENAKEKPTRGKVIAVGPGALDNGKRLPLDVKIDDVVLYGKYAGTDIELRGEPAKILKADEVIGIVEDDDGDDAAS